MPLPPPWPPGTCIHCHRPAAVGGVTCEVCHAAALAVTHRMVERALERRQTRRDDHPGRRSDD